MGVLNVYLKPFKSDGTYVDEFIDITADVSEDSIGSIKQQLDNSDFNVGVFSNDSINIKLNNQAGLYSEVGTLTSLFNYRRAGSIVRVEWLFGESAPICGMAICGEAILGPAQKVFEGFIEDKASPLDVEKQEIKFTVLGKESLFDSVETNYSALSNGDLVSEVIADILNVSGITNFLTIGDISPELDFAIDDVSGFENTTPQEVLDDLLAASNSILQVIDDVITVSSRDESVDTEYTFYGQASPNGVENIASIKNYRNGVNRLFNFWTWQDTTLVSKDASSISDYGVKKKEIDYSFVTNNTTRQSILDNLKSAYSNPKIEMELKGLWDLDTISLGLLDKVQIDYPTNNVPVADELLPLFGVGIFGTDKFPFSEFSLTISDLDRFKIIGKSVNLRAQEVTFKVREI